MADPAVLVLPDGHAWHGALPLVAYVLAGHAASKFSPVGARKRKGTSQLLSRF